MPPFTRHFASSRAASTRSRFASARPAMSRARKNFTMHLPSTSNLRRVRTPRQTVSSRSARSRVWAVACWRLPFRSIATFSDTSRPMTFPASSKSFCGCRTPRKHPPPRRLPAEPRRRFVFAAARPVGRREATESSRRSPVPAVTSGCRSRSRRSDAMACPIVRRLSRWSVPMRSITTTASRRQMSTRC